MYNINVVRIPVKYIREWARYVPIYSNIFILKLSFPTALLSPLSSPSLIQMPTKLQRYKYYYTVRAISNTILKV